MHYFEINNSRLAGNSYLPVSGISYLDVIFPRTAVAESAFLLPFLIIFLFCDVPISRRDWGGSAPILRL